jgi:predicted Zn finger-like uncharacterized protein
MEAEIGDLGVEVAGASDSPAMILTCPECATRYFVGDDQVGPEGRTVRCASCGHRWTAHAEPDLDLFVDPEQGAISKLPELTPVPDTPVSELPGDELPKVFRAKAETSRRVREAQATGVIWGGMTVFVSATLLLALVFKTDVARIWPRSASAFAAAGQPVNRIGLVPEKITFEPTLQNGHAALAVRGQLRNVTSKDVVSPPLQISLLNRQGKRVMAKIAAISNPKIPAGETRNFSIVLLDPPTTSVELDVTFVTDEKGLKLPAAAQAPEAPVAKAQLNLRGPADIEPAPDAASDPASIDPFPATPPEQASTKEP